MITEDKKIELINDHYKDTFANLQTFQKFRDWLFFIILIIIIIMLFQISSPLEANNIIGQIISKSLNLQNSIDTSFVGSIIWFSLLALVVRYFQTVIYIERQYKYLHELEELLSDNFAEKAFIREGKSYFSNRHIFLKFVHKMYKFVIPILVIFITLTKIKSEYNQSDYSNYFFLNILFLLLIIISVLLYLTPNINKFKIKNKTIRKIRILIHKVVS